MSASTAEKWMEAAMYKVFLLVLLLASAAGSGHGELFSSMAHLQTALYAERDIALEIRKYVADEQDRLNKLTRFDVVYLTLVTYNIYRTLY